MRRFGFSSLPLCGLAVHHQKKSSYSVTSKPSHGGKKGRSSIAPPTAETHHHAAPQGQGGASTESTRNVSSPSSVTKTTHTTTTTPPLPFPMSYYASHSLSPEAEGHPCKGSNYANVSENVDVSWSNPTKGRQEVRVQGSRGLFENVSNVEGGAWWNVKPAEANAASRASSVDRSYAYGASMPREGVTRYSRLFSVPTHADSGKNGVWAFPRDIR